ncbi:MAG TPA: hypothetical protein IAB40_06015 [Candidatus Onthocola stercoravium]|nr:hypothetical protein [Candidatus Onthocola stercoravium]
MKTNVKDIKTNVVLAFIILLLLFTICLVLYSKWNNEKIDVNTNINFEGGNDLLSQELQNIIPYVTTNNPGYLMAYQDKYVTLKQIDNDILLTKGYFHHQENTFNSGMMINSLYELYGSEVFIVNNNFNVNGKNDCTYDNYTYTCTTLEYEGTLYKADRDIVNVNINDNKLSLIENILFYSEETIQGVTYYRIYNNGLYVTSTLTITSNDLKKANVSFDNYISNNLSDSRVTYQSDFVINENNYNWIGTGII